MEGCPNLTKPFPNHVLITILLTLLLITQISASTPPKTFTNFIIASCNSTTYPSVCYKTLSPLASSIRTSPRKLVNYAITITIQAARNASKEVSKINKQKGLKRTESAAVKDCVENIKDTIDELKQSLKVLKNLGSGPNKKFQTANAKTWLSAALTDEDTCTDGVSGRRISVALRQKIRVIISGVTKLTSNALALVNHLEN